VYKSQVTYLVWEGFLPERDSEGQMEGQGLLGCHQGSRWEGCKRRDSCACFNGVLEHRSVGRCGENTEGLVGEPDN
jgi:hypothetical protein